MSRDMSGFLFDLMGRHGLIQPKHESVLSFDARLANRLRVNDFILRRLT